MFKNIKQDPIDKRIYTFVLENSHVTWANTLRRIMLTGIESIAFRTSHDNETDSDILVLKNDTPMTNQTLAHRISLIPIHVKDPLKWKSEDYTFKLDVTNDADKMLDVVAGDFEIWKKSEEDGQDVRVPTDTFFPSHPKTGETPLIAVLKPRSIGSKSTTGETLSLTAHATVGTGRENAIFIPVSQCVYTYTRDNDETRIKEHFEKWLINHKKVNPRTLDADDMTEKKAMYKREFDTMEIARVYLVNEKGEPTSFDFSVESVGVLDTPYIIQRAFEVAEAMCSRYVNVNTGPLPEEVTLSPADSRVIGFDFIFRGHDHTLGNMLQTWLVENHVEGDAQPAVTYAGYKVPHPLRDEMLLRIGVADGKESTAREALAAAARGCVGLWRSYRAAWMSSLGTAPITVKTAAPVSAPRTLRIVRSAVAPTTQ
jgi:DNA-directed RNA polymerase alpha subunit